MCELQEVNVSNATRTAIFAAIIAAAAPGAYAQTRAMPDTNTTTPGTQTTTPGTRTTMSDTHTTVTSHIIQPDEVRASKMIGSAVYDQQNRDIGKVSDIILNKDGRVDAVVVDVGSFLGMGGKYVAVPLNAIKTDNNRLTLDRTKEQLQQMAAYQLENRDTGAGTSTSPTTGGHLGR
jgi:sporulation protein YlmC with PRC-barrel domain